MLDGELPVDGVLRLTSTWRDPITDPLTSFLLLFFSGSLIVHQVLKSSPSRFLPLSRSQQERHEPRVSAGSNSNFGASNEAADVTETIWGSGPERLAAVARRFDGALFARQKKKGRVVNTWLQC